MLVFPNCKINLGLNVIQRRPDGFHDLGTVFYPFAWRDALEVVEAGGGRGMTLHTSGLGIGSGDNILHKAWALMAASRNLPAVDVYLHKTIPMGAGLGGGSADAAFFLKLMNETFGLGFSMEELTGMARPLGSDCAFFLHNKPVYATGKGDVFEWIDLDLSGYWLAVVYPGIHSNTREAYEGISPKVPARPVKDIVCQEPPENWKNLLVNDFEASIFKKYPEIERLKEKLYESGAVYASMSGSGSACYGIFSQKPKLDLPDGYLWRVEEPKSL